MKTYDLSDEKVQELNDLSLELGLAAQSLTPDLTTWGFYSAMRGPAGMGSGAFMWFESKEKMMGYIHIYPFSLGGAPEEEEWKAVDSIAGKYNRGELSGDEFCKQINEILCDPYIDWIGTFDDLKNGRGKFAKELVQDFREDNADSSEEKSETTPFEIQADQVESFLEYIQMYGV